MKKLLIVLGLIFVFACNPSMYVNPNSQHNFYNKYRAETYTSPTWIPGIGVVLETHIIPKYRYYEPRYKQQRALRRKY
jgi:hypothetical protein